MKKKKHLHTNFIKFLIERYKNISETEDDIEPLLSEDEVETQPELKKKGLRPIEIPFEEEEEGEENGSEDDNEIIEKLLFEYQKLKRQYESDRIRYKRK